MLWAALAASDVATGPAVPFPALVSGGASENDYPPASLRFEEEGRTKVIFKIGSSGKVVSCAVDATSGFDRLDQATCRVVSRMTFQMTPASAEWVNQPRKTGMRWQIPKSDTLEQAGGAKKPVSLPDETRGINIADSTEIASGRRVNVLVSLNITAAGTVQSCESDSGSYASEVLSRKACAIAIKWLYKPALMNGAPVDYRLKENVRWAAPDFVAQ